MHQKTTLDNGLRVVTTNMPHTRSVSIFFFIGVGSRYENEAQAGISHFIEHLLFKGTQKRPTAGGIWEAIEGGGGVFNGGTDKELTLYWCKAARHHFPLALDVLVDMLLNSRFTMEDIERERQVITEEINMTKDSPSQWVNVLIDELLWSEHPLGRDIAGCRESVGAITRDMMLHYLQSRYQPGNMAVSIAGDIQHEEIVAAVRQSLGDWTGHGDSPAYLPYEERTVRRLCVERRDTEQAHLCLALPGLSLHHPRRFVLDLLNVVLGGGMSSRLFIEIRDKLGLAYSINSYAEHFLDTGSMIICAGVEPGKLSVAIKAILEQLSRLKEPVPESELSKAKELSKGRLLLRMEDSHNVAGWAGGQEILSRKVLSVEEVVSIIDAITAEDLQELSRELLLGSRLRLAIVGPVDDDESLEGLLTL